VPNLVTSGYGSFHQKYYYKGELIALSVLDILPESVSSVYFMYNPEYEKLSLGTFSALKEIQLTLQLQKQLPKLKYYYMGLYIHNCTKMKYKAEYHPSYLLDPVCIFSNVKI
jgi:arginine-tRNA-protein transferase